MSGAGSYFDWLEHRTRRPRKRRPLEPEVENHVAPSEPLEVQADTTMSRRIREALRKRLRGD